MPQIDEFTDDPKYTIRAVAVQTGIRPVTLRAWERRHEVLTPHRADNRYRLYSERDVAILRWLKSQVDNGISISNAAAELRTMARRNLWPEAVPSAPTPQPGTQASPPEEYVRRLSDSLIRHEEMAAANVLREAHAIFDLATVFEGIVVPTLVEIGEAWYTGRIRITTEHFASTFLRGKLLSLLQAYPVRRSAPYILLGCAPQEQHEIGSLMVSVLLRSQGYRVEFLGPDVPLDDLVDYASYEKPDMIVLAALSRESALSLSSMQKKLRKLRAAPIFAYGGRAFDNDPALLDVVPGHYLGKTLDKAASAVRELLSR